MSEEINTPEEELLGLTVDEALEKAVLFAFDEASTYLEQGGQFVPFSIVVEGENLYIENHPGEDVAECFEAAQRTIHAYELKMDSYVFCYDGYVDVDDETADAIIVEAAKPGDADARAYALIYTVEESPDGATFTFDEALADLGPAPVLFVKSEFELEEI